MVKGRRVSKYEKDHGTKSFSDLAKKQKRNKVPVFENPIHLIQSIYKQYYDQELINFYVHNVYSIANDTSKHYKRTFIPKRNGKKREINEPDKDLKFIQKVLSTRFFNKFYNARRLSCAHGFIDGRSIRSNANSHLKHNFLLKLDIKDFFPSIKENLVFERCFGKDLYPESVKVLITKLVTLNGALPQGAPTSPIISNIVMSDFDMAMMKYANEHHLSYTRYADDIAISSNERFDHKEVISFVKTNLFEINHMKLNMKKIVFVGNGSKKEICGVLVNEKLQVSKEYRDSIRQEMYFINKNGIQDHINYLFYEKHKLDKLYSVTEYARILLGKINHVLNIDKNNKQFIAYKKQLEELTGKKIRPDISRQAELDLRDKLEFYLVRRKELVIDDDTCDDEEKAIKIANLKKSYYLKPKSNDWYDISIAYLASLFRHEVIEDKLSKDLDVLLEPQLKDSRCYAYLMILCSKIMDAKEAFLDYWVKVGMSIDLSRAYYIAYQKESNPAKKLELIKKAADLRDPEAQYVYYKKHAHGEEEKATYLLASAANGFKDAYVEAADYLFEKGLEYFALDFYRRAYDSDLYEYMEDVPDTVLVRLYSLSKKLKQKLPPTSEKYIESEIKYRNL